MDAFCTALAADIDTIAATAPPKSESFVQSKENWIMHPLNQDSAEVNMPYPYTNSLKTGTDFEFEILGMEGEKYRGN